MRPAFRNMFVGVIGIISIIGSIVSFFTKAPMMLGVLGTAVMAIFGFGFMIGRRRKKKRKIVSGSAPSWKFWHRSP